MHSGLANNGLAQCARYWQGVLGGRPVRTVSAPSNVSWHRVQRQLCQFAIKFATGGQRAKMGTGSGQATKLHFEAWPVPVAIFYIPPRNSSEPTMSAVIV